MKRRGINNVVARAVVARAMNHGVIFSNSQTDYGTCSRRAWPQHHFRWAEGHLRSFLNRQPERTPDGYYTGSQAYAAMRSALAAVIYASGEWCPDVEDIGLLLHFAMRADAGFDFRPAIVGDVYSQYSQHREGLPVEHPLSGITGCQAKVEADIRPVLSHVQAVRKSWGLGA